MAVVKTAERWVCDLFFKNKRLDEGYVTAVWDLNRDPMSFDFAWFLVGAELFSKKNGKDSFFVNFIRSSDAVEIGPPGQRIIDVSEVHWRFENIVLPLINLFPACIGHSVVPKTQNLSKTLKGKLVYPEFYDGKYTPSSDHHRDVCLSKEKFLGFRAPLQGIRSIKSWKKANKITKNIVTITLRQYDYDQVRNSNVFEWVKFANLVFKQGLTPVFIPDTYACFELDDRLDGFIVFQDPCWNLGLRMALYEESYLNFFVSNGPVAIAMLNKKIKVIYIKLSVEDSLESGIDVYENRGLKVGQRRYDFAEEYQVLSWEEDSFENIRDEFYRFLKEYPPPDISTLR